MNTISRKLKASMAELLMVLRNRPEDEHKILSSGWYWGLILFICFPGVLMAYVVMIKIAALNP